VDSSPCSEGWVLCYVIATYRFWLSHPNRGFQRKGEANLLSSPPLRRHWVTYSEADSGFYGFYGNLECVAIDVFCHRAEADLSRA